MFYRFPMRAAASAFRIACAERSMPICVAVPCRAHKNRMMPFPQPKSRTPVVFSVSHSKPLSKAIFPLDRVRGKAGVSAEKMLSHRSIVLSYFPKIRTSKRWILYCPSSFLHNILHDCTTLRKVFSAYKEVPVRITIQPPGKCTTITETANVGRGMSPLST